MVDTTTDKFGILSIRGYDEIGVEATALGFLAKHGANLIDEDTRTLRNYFTGILVFKAKAHGMRRITEEADDVLRNFEPVVKQIEEPERAPHRLILKYDLDVMAEDEPSIAATIAKLMRERCVNMKEIRGSTLQTYGHGTDLYSGSFRLEIGNAGTLRRLREDLLELEDKRGWEIDLRPSGSPSRQFQVFTVGVPLKPGGKPRMVLSKP